MPQPLIILAAFLVGWIVALLAERAFHASGRHGIHLRPLRSTARRKWAGVQPSPEDVQEMLRGYNLFVSIARGPLSRVIGVGAEQTSDGTTVEFISVELRKAGGRGLVRVHSSKGYGPPRNPPDRPSSPSPPSIQDDLGTDYAVGWSSWGGSGGDDDHSEFTAEFWFAPAPPSGARRLEVSIPQLDPSGVRQESELPPWVFDVPL